MVREGGSDIASKLEKASVAVRGSSARVLAQMVYQLFPKSSEGDLVRGPRPKGFRGAWRWRNPHM